MRILVALGLLVAFLPAASAQTAIEFSTPAQFGTNVVHENLTWMIILMDVSSQSQFSLSAQTVESGFNHSLVRLKSSNAGISQSNAPEVWSMPQTWEGPMDAQLTFGGGWSMLRLSGIDLELVATGAQGHMYGPDPVGSFRASLGIPPGEYRAIPTTPTTFELEPLINDLAFRIRGTVTNVEWHNATTTCASSMCPDGAQSQPLATETVFVSQSYFAEWQLQGTIAGEGRAHAILAGGHSPDLAVDGAIRLPRAVAACQACGNWDSNGTLHASGNTTLLAIGPHPASGRMQANLAGSPSLRHDENSVSLSRLAIPVAGVAVIGITVLTYKLGLAFLLSRDRDLLENEGRRRVLDHVLANPGITVNELRRQLGIGNGTTIYHLRVLQNAGMLAEYKQGNRRLLYENHGRYRESWKQVAVLRNSFQASLLDWLRQNPGARQKDILGWALALGLKRSALQDKLDKLAKAGLILTTKTGRTRRYEVNPPLPSSPGIPGPEIGRPLLHSP